MLMKWEVTFKRRELERCTTVLKIKQMEEIHEFKYSGNLINPDGDRDLENK
jgi:hypothetical protein